MGTATVRTVAIHAVMAGCKSECLPIVLGGISLMLRPDLNLNAVQAIFTGTNVITCAMTDPPGYCFDDSSTEPERLLTGICACAGMGRAAVAQRLRELAGRPVLDLKRGGIWLTERAEKLHIDFYNEDLFVPAIKHPDDLHVIVSGGPGPITAVLSGWGGGSIAVHGEYTI